MTKKQNKFNLQIITSMRQQNYKKDFNGQNIFVGIDVHLKTWSVSVALPGGYLKTHTQKASAKELFEHLKKNYPNGTYHAVYESGFSGYSTCYALRELGVDCIIVHAADVPTTQKEKVTKSDPTDSRKLARSLMNGELDGIYVHSKDNLDDRGLLRHRTMLLKLSGGIKSRIKHLLYNNGVAYPEEFTQKSRHWSRRFISWLQHDVQLLSETRVTLDLLIQELLYFRARILDVNKKIRVLAETDRYREQYENLISIPGVGAIISMCLLTEIDDIRRFSNQRQFASFLGLVPVMQASGDDCYVGEKTFRGNKILGPKIIEASWITIKHDTELAAKFGKLCCKGMKRNKAIVRVARKLSNIIFTILRENRKYVCR